MNQRWVIILCLAAVVQVGCSADVAGPNRPPVAVAGPDRTVSELPADVPLDASSSYDPEGQALTCRWRLLAASGGADASLVGVQDCQAALTVRTPGTYVLELVVSDGSLESPADVLVVRALLGVCSDPADCDDGQWCTLDDCVAGGCTHIGRDCDDADPCTADACDEASAGCTHELQPVPGAEGLALGNCGNGLDDDCDELVDDADPDCQPCDDDGDCDDGEDCSVDTCDPVDGCLHAPIGDGTDCGSVFCDALQRVQGTCSGMACSGQRLIEDCADTDPCTADGCTSDTCEHGVAGNGTPCDDGDPCTGTSSCQGGSCTGAVDLDADADGYVSDACAGGTDCDDSDGAVSPGALEGPVCGGAAAYAACYDTVDNDCDGDVDGLDAGCSAGPFICVEGPAGAVPAETGGTVTVWLDAPGYDPSQIVCFTQDERLLPPDPPLLDDDFEDPAHSSSAWEASHSDGSIRRDPAAENPLEAGGADGLAICQDGRAVTSQPLNTVGRSRLLLRYAARSVLFDSTENFLVEYSPDNGSTWFLLLQLGDAVNPDDFQFFEHRLPPEAEGVTQLRIRFRVVNGAADECGYVDDVVLTSLPEPTVGRTLAVNGFEPGEGNSDIGGSATCTGETIALFPYQCDDGRTCLSPNSAHSGLQGVYLDNKSCCLRRLDFDTRTAPAGSDLWAEAWLRTYQLTNDDVYSLWRYSLDAGTTWWRMDSAGLNIQDGVWQWFRFRLPPQAVGIDSLGVDFNTPAEAGGMAGRGVDIDEFALHWTRASLDTIGPFSDNGDGSYSATITSALGGQIQVSCIFYGETPPLVTDGAGDSSGPASVSFTGFARRRKLMFQSHGINEALVDFPLLVHLDAGRIDYTLAGTGGAGLRFFDADGSPLSHEVENWDPAGASVVWVKVPQLDAASDGDFIWLAYGHPDPGPAPDPTAVWNSDYVGVWHLAETSGTTAVDATGHGYDGTFTGGVTLGEQGQYGDLAAGFDGSDDFIDLGTGLDVTGSGITMEAVAFLPVSRPSTEGRFLSKSNGSAEGAHWWMLSLVDGDDLRARLKINGATSTFATNSNALAGAGWYFLAATYSAGLVRLYVNLALPVGISATNGTISTSSSVVAAIGANGGSVYEPIQATLSEVRLSSVARSVNWLAAQQRAVDGTRLTSLVRWGQEEGAP